MTTTRTRTLRDAFNEANPVDIADAARKIDLGTMLSPIKATIAALGATAAPDITSAAVLAAATLDGIDLADGEMLPPIGVVRTFRVTAVGTGALGPRHITDAGGTPSAPGANGPGIATIDDAGEVITLEGTITGFIIEYYPRPAYDLDEEPTSL